MSEKGRLGILCSNIYESFFCCGRAADRQESIPGAARYLNVEKCMSAFIDRNTDRPFDGWHLIPQHKQEGVFVVVEGSEARAYVMTLIWLIYDALTLRASVCRQVLCMNLEQKT